ncbi:MAG: hypothetical protein MK106_09690 [Mariniblastus sp.]|nr:hypothetical protein [Mariniblastus sp.]
MTETWLGRGMQQVACASCSLLCDDIEAGFDQHGDWLVKGACSQGRRLLEKVWQDHVPQYKVGSRTVNLATAVQAAKDLLIDSRMPLITGLSGVGMECQQVAMRLAREIASTIDVDCDPDRSRQLAFQRVGGVTATLGEVRNRADWLVFWCCDPTQSHPRFWERSDADSKKVMVIGPTDWTKGRADHFVPLQCEQSADAIAVCQGIVQEAYFDPASIVAATGVELSGWEAVLQLLNQANYVACICDAGVSDASCWNVTQDRMSDWSIMMNRQTRFVCLQLGQQANRLAAENVLAMNTGFSSGVSLMRSQPEFNYLEYATETLLSRKEVDSILLISGVGVERLSKDARKRLGEIPKIVFQDDWSSSQVKNLDWNEGDVSVRAGGMMMGEWARMDDVLLPFPVELDPYQNPGFTFLSHLLEAV